MIINFQELPSLVKPHTFFDSGNFEQFRSVVFLLPGTTFSDEDDFTNESTWLTKLENGDLFIMHGVWKVEPEHQEVQWHESQQNFRYPTNEGKYRYKIHFDKSFDTYKKYIQFNFRDLQVMFYDGNNLLGKLNTDGTIQGFETSTVHFEKIPYGQAAPKPYTTLNLELEDSDESFDAMLSAIDWKFEDLERVPVTISNAYVIGSTLTELYFEVNDNEFDHPIYGLDLDDITLNDNGGASATLLEKTQKGYKLTTDSNAGDGTISIDSKYYYTSQSFGYNFGGVIDVTLSSISTNGRNELSVTVERTDNSDPVTVLEKEDFEIDSGAVNIDTVTHEGSGVYTIATFTDLSNSGTVEVIDPVYQGSGNYTYTKLQWDMSIEALALYKDKACIDVDLRDTDDNRIEQGQGVFDIDDFNVNDELPGNNLSGNVYWIMFLELENSQGLSDGDTISYDNGEAEASHQYQLFDVLFFDNFLTSRQLFIDGDYYGFTPQWLSQAMKDDGDLQIIGDIGEAFDIDLVNRRWEFDAGDPQVGDSIVIVKLQNIIDYDETATYRCTMDIHSFAQKSGSDQPVSLQYGTQWENYTSSGVKTFDVTAEDAAFKLWFFRGTEVSINSIKIEKIS